MTITSTASLLLSPKDAARFWSKLGEPDTTSRLVNGHYCRRWTACTTTDGYGLFRLDGVMRYQHRIVFTNRVGEIPPGLSIDHECHVHDCGEITHLRVADDTDQKRNPSGPPSNNTSGVTGVYWNKATGKWQTQIKVDGRSIYLGSFGLFEFPKAVAARKAAEIEYGWYSPRAAS